MLEGWANDAPAKPMTMSVMAVFRVAFLKLKGFRIFGFQRPVKKRKVLENDTHIKSD
jgi:hypothetical protein